MWETNRPAIGNHRLAYPGRLALGTIAFHHHGARANAIVQPEAEEQQSRDSRREWTAMFADGIASRRANARIIALPGEFPRWRHVRVFRPRLADRPEIHPDSNDNIKENPASNHIKKRRQSKPPQGLRPSIQPFYPKRPANRCCIAANSQLQQRTITGLPIAILPRIPHR